MPKAPPRSRKAAVHGAGAERNCGSAACNAFFRCTLPAHTNVCAQLFLRCDPGPSSCTLCLGVLGRALCSVLGVGVTVPYRTGSHKDMRRFYVCSPRAAPATRVPKRPQRVAYAISTHVHNRAKAYSCMALPLAKANPHIACKMQTRSEEIRDPPAPRSSSTIDVPWHTPCPTLIIPQRPFTCRAYQLSMMASLRTYVSELPHRQAGKVKQLR